MLSTFCRREARRLSFWFRLIGWETKANRPTVTFVAGLISHTQRPWGSDCWCRSPGPSPLETRVSKHSVYCKLLPVIAQRKMDRQNQDGEWVLNFEQLKKRKGRKNSSKQIKLFKRLSLEWHFGVDLNCCSWLEKAKQWKREKSAFGESVPKSLKSNFNSENSYIIVLFSISMAWECKSKRMSSVPQLLNRKTQPFKALVSDIPLA